MPRTILFVFAGRRPNIELALPYYRRILADNPDTELHLWDLCRSPLDSRYLRTIGGERIRIRRDFYGLPPAAGQSKAWQHYASERYRDCTFVKADDDDVFWETDRFADFVQAGADNPDTAISALTINNGASTPHIPDLNAKFTELGIPLLDVHLSVEYAEMCHRWFIANGRSAIGRKRELISTDDWLSINCLALSWTTLRAIAELIGTPSPPVIAGRKFPRINARGRISGHLVGDEGAANMLPRAIYRGFTVSHFTFGPQEQKMSPELQADLRAGYAAIRSEYLE